MMMMKCIQYSKDNIYDLLPSGLRWRGLHLDLVSFMLLNKLQFQTDNKASEVRVGIQFFSSPRKLWQSSRHKVKSVPFLHGTNETTHKALRILSRHGGYRLLLDPSSRIMLFSMLDCGRKFKDDT